MKLKVYTFLGLLNSETQKRNHKNPYGSSKASGHNSSTRVPDRATRLLSIEVWSRIGLSSLLGLWGSRVLGFWVWGFDVHQTGWKLGRVRARRFGDAGCGIRVLEA